MSVSLSRAALLADAPDFLAAWPTHIREHVSASSLTMFMRCPEQWRHRYVLDEKEPPRSDLIWGSAHHGALEHNFKRKLTTFTDLSIAEIKDRFAHLVDERIEELGGAAAVDWKEEGEDGERLSPAAVKDRGTALVGLYQEEVAPFVQPLAVEREFKLPIAGLPVPVLGRIDLEAAVAHPDRPQPAWRESERCRVCDRFLGLEGPLIVARGVCAFCAGDRVIDSKTAGQNRMQPDSKIQAWVYQLERPLPVDFHLAIKPKLNKSGVSAPRTAIHTVDVAPEARTRYLLEGTMRQVAIYLSVYGADQPWPTSALRDSWACNYCGFKPRCVYHADAEWRGALF